MTPPVVFGIAAVLGTLAVSPLSLGARALVALGIVLLCAYAARPGEPRLVRAGALCALVVCAAGAAHAQRHVPTIAEHRTARYWATALSPVSSGGATSSFTANLQDGLTVLVETRDTPPPPGAAILIRGRLAPFDQARNPGEPSQASLERERGFDAQIESAAILATRAGGACDSRCTLARAHAWALQRLRDALGEPAASIVAGELWGERGDLPPDLRAEFQETGTVHVLVTAGLHLGVVAVVVLAFLTRLGLARIWTCALAIAAVWLFVIWSGSQLPATRAACMVSAALAARACGRSSLSWNSLALAAIALAVVRPLSVGTPSFALSFSCVGAIFAVAPLLQRALEEHAALPALVREAVVLSIATQIGTWPLTAAIFLQFSPYAILANLGVVPCVGVSIVLGALVLAFAWLPPLAQAFANLDAWIVAWMLAVVRILASLPAGSIPMSPAPSWCIAAYDAALLAFVWCVRRGAATLGVAVALAAISLVLFPEQGADSGLHITVLDVGQADSIVIETPAHHALLVDTGGRLERGPQTDGSIAERVGERIVVPFLLRHGIHSLDAVVVTHPHGDHVGGCAPVLRKIRVAEIADGGQRYGGHAYHDCLDTAHADGVPVVHPRAGDEWHTDDGLVLHFIGPSLPFISGGNNDINDNSIAFTLRYRSFCMLFTGDAGTSAEQRFLREGVNLHCTVLKVGHHGSAYGTTPELLEAVRPRIAIISVGRHNMFGHPAPSTVARLEAYGAKVYRTDENGAVTVTTDGSKTAVSAELQ
ncbi:MAG: DNA internalization-related competence protein ComEC/Rec2 [Candidatus Tyrphobacter sp.]